MRCLICGPVVERGGNCGAVSAGERIQQRQARTGVEGQHRLVLGVDDRQVRSKLLEHGHRCRLVVDEDASLAAGGDLAPQDELAVIGVASMPLASSAATSAGESASKTADDDGLLRPVANGVGGSFVAQQQGERVDEDGLSGAGFAGQQVEAGSELHGHVVNDRVVFDPQFQQHVRSRFSEVRRSVARQDNGKGAPSGAPGEA